MMLALTLEWMVALFLPLEAKNMKYHNEIVKCKDSISIIQNANLLHINCILDSANENEVCIT